MKQLNKLLKTEKNEKPAYGRHVKRLDQKTTAGDDECRTTFFYLYFMSVDIRKNTVP